MAGMQGLGRVFNVVHDASGNMFTLDDASAVTFVVKANAASSLAVVAAKTFGGSTTTWTTANGFGQTGFWFQATAANGTVGWTKQTSVWSSNSITLAGTSGYVSVLTIYTSQFADAYQYIQVTGTGTATVVAFLHDLTVQRTPANLRIVGA